MKRKIIASILLGSVMLAGCGQKPVATEQVTTTSETTLEITIETSETSFETSESETESSEEDYYIDFDEYYSSHGTIISVTNVKDSDKVLIEAEVYKLLESRGLTTYPVEYYYDIDGNYLVEPVKVDPTSDVKHPMYSTTYINSSDEIWYIEVINGEIYATPISFHFRVNQDNLNLKAEVCVYETVLFGYASTTNKYYQVIPNDDVLTLYKITRIDADTLDKLDVQSLITTFCS